MSTTTPIQDITKALNAPGAITGADVEQAELILESYPYFVPARYIAAADMHSEHAFAPATMANMQLYKGNWLLYYQYLQSSVVTGGRQFGHQPAHTIEASKPYAASVDTEAEEVEEIHVAENNVNYIVEHIELDKEPASGEDDALISPIYTEDYFLHQGVQVSNDMPEDVAHLNDEAMEDGTGEDEDKSLMVVMSFTQWLHHFKTKTQREREEREDQKVLKTMWQKEKLAGALEEENEEIPENVFEMAVNSITREDDLMSEPLIEIYVKQGKYDKAIEMCRKLSLRNPQKNVYFARKIEEILKEKES